MPIRRASYRDCFDHAFLSDDPDLSIKISLEDHADHPITRKIDNVYFLSSSSLKDLPNNVEFELKTPLSAIMHPIGYKDPEGWMIKIDDWKLDRQDSVTVCAAWRHGKGKVVAVGSWKICSQDRGDNTLLVDNILNWLSAK